MPTEKVSPMLLRFTDDDKAWIKKYAKASDRTQADVIRRALHVYQSLVKEGKIS